MLGAESAADSRRMSPTARGARTRVPSWVPRQGSPAGGPTGSPRTASTQSRPMGEGFRNICARGRIRARGPLRARGRIHTRDSSAPGDCSREMDASVPGDRSTGMDGMRGLLCTRGPCEGTAPSTSGHPERGAALYHPRFLLQPGGTPPASGGGSLQGGVGTGVPCCLRRHDFTIL